MYNYLNLRVQSAQHYEPALILRYIIIVDTVYRLLLYYTLTSHRHWSYRETSMHHTESDHDWPGRRRTSAARA